MVYHVYPQRIRAQLNIVTPCVTNHQGSAKHVHANTKKLKAIQNSIERAENTLVTLVLVAQSMIFGNFKKSN
jgi:hypothetical protein